MQSDMVMDGGSDWSVEMLDVLLALLTEALVTGWKSACERDPRRRRIRTHLRHTIHPYLAPARGLSSS